MTPSLENIITIADRDLAAGRYADAEKEYGRALELDPTLYEALHGRGVAHTWQSTMFDGNPIALIASTDDALHLCRESGGDEDEFLMRIALDLTLITSCKYNAMTRIYRSVETRENQTAPSPLFYYTWAISHPGGLALSDIAIPLINYLDAMIRVSEYLDKLLDGHEILKNRRLHNVGNLAVFYDWMVELQNDTGRVNPAYLAATKQKAARLAVLRERLEEECSAPEFANAPSELPQGRPLPGAAADVDVHARVAHFGVRPPLEVICPLCGTIQRSNRSLCFRCSCRFEFDD